MNEPLWWITKDGDSRAARFFDRHYSRQFYRDGRTPKLFCGPGQKIVLRTYECDALFIWRKFIDKCIDERTGLPQDGINCAVFRNEGGALSSELIRQADAIADFCWPCERHYTYVDAGRIRSANPGFCFIVAGWKRCGTTKGGLVILERKPLSGQTVPNAPTALTSASGVSCPKCEGRGWYQMGGNDYRKTCECQFSSSPAPASPNQTKKEESCS